MVKLEKGVHTANNMPIVYLSGNTYPIYKYLGKAGLGFNWYKARKIWWMYKEKFNNDKLEQLKKLGVDISGYNTSSVAPEGGSDAPEGNQVVPEGNQTIPEINPSQEEPVPEVTNKTDSDEYIGHSYDRVPGERYMGFKVKTNIYSTEFNLNIDGEEVPVKVVFDRYYLKGRRKIPRYVYNLSYNGKAAWRGSINAPGPWGSYNEDKLALEIPEKIQHWVDNNPKQKISRNLKHLILEGKREPELTKWLEEWGDISDKEKSKDFWNQKIPKKYVHLDEPGYEGDYPIRFADLGGTIYGHTDIDHPLAPYAPHILYSPIEAYVHTFEDLNKFIDENMKEQYEDMQKKYLKYLKSFPFKKEEEEQSRVKMDEVVSMIGKNYDVQFFRNKLSELGYIRPNKRVKNDLITPGFIPLDKIKWVIDSKKIVNDAYSFTQNPDQFYGAIAYWLHRKARNISSWTDMMLVDIIRHWHNLSQRYGHNISREEVEKYFDRISSDIYRDLYKNEPKKNVWENYQDFYGGGQGTQSKRNPVSKEKALEDFINFAISLGVDRLSALANPKKVYRELAIKLHPDLNPGDPEAEKKFIRLSELYNNMPTEVIRANNWYNKIKRS